MKKLLVISLLLSAFALTAREGWQCSPCGQANKHPDRFHFVKAYTHGAPIEAIDTACNCQYKTNDYVVVAGYASLDCKGQDRGTKKSIRVYDIAKVCNVMNEMEVDYPAPSDYLYSAEMCCPENGNPFFVVAGCPGTDHNVVWVYERQEPDTDHIDCWWKQACAWGAEYKPELIYSAAVNCDACPDGSYQIAAVGKANERGEAKIWLLKYTPNADPCLTKEGYYSLQSSTQGGDLFKAAWLPKMETNDLCNKCNIPCTILTVGGQYVGGEDCKSGNIHNFYVDCNYCIHEVITDDPNCGDGGVFTLGDSNFKVRQLVWTTECCGRLPYPFLLAIGDQTVVGTPNTFVSLIQVYWFDYNTGCFKPLAFKYMPGKMFAGQFIPGCDCKAVAFAGGCITYEQPCGPNIWAFKYDCAPTYPVEMTEITHTSFNTVAPADEVITSLAFCKERGCYSMIVGSEAAAWGENALDPLCAPARDKGEIGMFKVNFCQDKHHAPCPIVPICQRKNIKEIHDIPCRSR